MFFTFRISGGQELNFEFSGPKAIVGRQTTCDIIIPHNEVSRSHMLIEVQGEDVFITDLESKNGVTLSGVKIKPKTRTLYKMGATLTFGAAGQARITKEASGPLQKQGAADATGSMTRTMAIKPGFQEPVLELEEKPVYVEQKKSQNLGKLYEGVHEEKIEEAEEKEPNSFKQKLPGIILIILVGLGLAWWKSKK